MKFDLNQRNAERFKTLVEQNVVFHEFNTGDSCILRKSDADKHTIVCTELVRGTGKLYDIMNSLFLDSLDTHSYYVQLPAKLTNILDYPKLMLLYCQEVMMRSYAINEYAAVTFMLQLQGFVKQIAQAKESYYIMRVDTTHGERLTELVQMFMKCFYVPAPIPVFWTILCNSFADIADCLFIMSSDRLASFNSDLNHFKWDSITSAFCHSCVIDYEGLNNCVKWCDDRDYVWDKFYIKRLKQLAKDKKIGRLLKAYLYVDFNVE